MCFRRRIRLFNARYYPDLSSKCEKNKYNLHLGWKNHNQCQARQKVHLMPSAGKSSASIKRGKKFAQCRTWKAKRGKKFIEHKAKENIYP